jgi:hypothetical protein
MSELAVILYSVSGLLCIGLLGAFIKIVWH